MRASPDNEITPQRPMPVIDLVEGVSCPIFIVGGQEDQNPSPGDLEALQRRLEAGGKDATVKVYPEAGHAFFADYRPTYREPAAFQLWDDVVDFFAKRLPR
jgi:carboxymethylenebutenolidase